MPRMPWPCLRALGAVSGLPTAGAKIFSAKKST
jgi:hypothetical protein